MTAKHYETHGKDFFDATVGVDMTSLYVPFLDGLAPGDRILDAGCGSGRDARFFIERGFHVSAFDLSPTMASLASQFTGLNVEVAGFLEFNTDEPFDGVWACASLLHLERESLHFAFTCIRGWLASGGRLYASFKRGTTTRRVGQRTFTDLTSNEALTLVEGAGLELGRIWETADARPDRSGESWVNILARRT